MTTEFLPGLGTDQPEKSSIFPYVSVIIPIHNGEADLPDLIRCLYAQTYPRHLVEYLLVDNNSDDRTAEMIKAAALKAETQELKIHYLSETQVQSSYAARNAGIRASKSEIIAFTDADCRPCSEWLWTLVQPFADSTVGLVGGAITSLPGETLIEKYSERRKLLSHKGKLRHPFYPFAQTANLAVRRDAFVKVGLFRPHLTTGGDADICWRIQMQTDWQLQGAENAKVEHRHRATIAELISQFRRYGRSEEYLSELYDVDLRKEWTWKSDFLKWSRWVMREMPGGLKNMILNDATLLDLTVTPIRLIADRAREAGRKSAKLSDKAREIEWL